MVESRRPKFIGSHRDLILRCQSINDGLTSKEAPKSSKEPSFEVSRGQSIDNRHLRMRSRVGARRASGLLCHNAQIGRGSLQLSMAFSALARAESLK